MNKKRYFLLILSCLMIVGFGYRVNYWEKSGNAVTPSSNYGLKIPGSETLPATCGVRDMYIKIDATSGQLIYVCESADTWVLQGDGGESLVNSAGLAAELNDEEGTGKVVFSDSPNLTTPNIGAATGTSFVATGAVTADLVRTCHTSEPSVTVGKFYCATGAWDPTGQGLGGTSHIVQLISTGPNVYKIVSDADGNDYVDTIQGAMKVFTDADIHAAGNSVTVAQMNSILYMTEAGDVMVPDVCDSGTGFWITIVSSAAHLNSVDITDAADDFLLADGSTVDGNANEVDLAGSIGSQGTFLCIAAGIWYVSSGTVTDGGADD